MIKRQKTNGSKGPAIETAAASLHQVDQQRDRVLNCVPSLVPEDDWRIDTAVRSGLVDADQAIPVAVDLRENWWTIRDQKSTGACVGFAAADGVLRWHFVKANLIHKDEQISPRFIWMANKETDEITSFATTFIESAGTQTKSALKIANRWGCLLDKDLPMDGPLWRDTTVSLYSRAARLRIESFFNLGRDLADWRLWLATKGPILTRLSVDDAFMSPGKNANNRLTDYDSENTLGGHAVAIVGYTPEYFIIRNSWGVDWGHEGFVYANDSYVAKAFTEAYGVVVSSHSVGKPAIGPPSPAWNSQHEPLTEPRFEGLTIELTGNEGNPTRRMAAVARDVLGNGHGWRVEAVHESEPLDFDLLPHLGREDEVDVAKAWDICHELQKHVDVAFAEPSFVLYQDNDPNISVPGGFEVEPIGSDDTLAPAVLAAAGLPLVEVDWRDWSPMFIRAREAWATPPRKAGNGFLAGKRRGEGVRIGHPDSGYRSHRELWNPQVEPRMRILKDLDHDFVDNDLEPKNSDGNHGLATASVIMSWEPMTSGPSPTHEITGVAPRADIVPLRVAKVRKIIPTPVLLRSGMIRLRKAINYGIDQAGCEIFSISLGWLPNRSVHKAIKRAVKKHNAIICAAAGNHIRFVVWPAHYKETICVAGCNYRGGKWKGSSRGRRVDVTAPGEDVWKADHTLDVRTSSGTSYSTASTAGLAALWLAHWGRDYLLDKYSNLPLGEVFRYVLKRSSVRPPGWNRSKWGSGIINSKATLEMVLPEAADVRRAMNYKSNADQVAGKEQFSVLAQVFDQVPLETLKSRLSALTGGADSASLAGYEDELTFHVLTSPVLRDALSGATAMDDEDGATAASETLGQGSLSASLCQVLKVKK